jgi:hypothetical protein
MTSYGNNFICDKPRKKFAKLFDINGKILTYNKDKSNKGLVEYTENIFVTNPSAAQIGINCI